MQRSIWRVRIQDFLISSHKCLPRVTYREWFSMVFFNFTAAHCWLLYQRLYQKSFSQLERRVPTLNVLFKYTIINGVLAVEIHFFFLKRLFYRKKENRIKALLSLLLILLVFSTYFFGFCAWHRTAAHTECNPQLEESQSSWRQWSHRGTGGKRTWRDWDLHEWRFDQLREIWLE